MKSTLAGFTSLATLLVAAPHLLRIHGAILVMAAPMLAIGLLAVRSAVRGRAPRALLLGAAVGFALLFAYGFSPPVLERIGHAIGWPGPTLRLWEKFTAPVYDYCCTYPWFWRIFEVWDVLTVMLVDHLGPTASFILLPVLLLAALAVGLVLVRRRRARPTGPPVEASDDGGPWSPT
jgi:hypothetical protein